MIHIGKYSDGTDVYINDDGYFVWENNGMKQVLTNDDFYLIDREGNVISLLDMNNWLKPNIPTYDELYEHWLKTKQND